MSSLEAGVLGYLLNSMWQVLQVFCAAWTMARVLRRLGPEAEHRVWVGALGMAVVLPVCTARPNELLRGVSELIMWTWRGGSAGHAKVTAVQGAGYAHSTVALPSGVLACVVVTYGCCVAYFAARLGWSVWKTRELRQQAKRVALTGEVERRWKQRCDVLRVQVVESGAIAGPVVIGVRQPALLLPPEWLQSLPETDLDAVLAHELAHVRRMDFAKNVLYQVLALPMMWHPALWLIRRRLAESREMVCDAMAAGAVAGRQEYARSLLRLAGRLSDRTQAGTLHAIGIFDANNLERRVMRLTERRAAVKGMRRVAILATCVSAGLVTCASALALRMGVEAPERSPSQMAAPQSTGRTIRVSGGVMAGNILSRVAPVYPPKAKEDKITGAVVLHAVIDKAGTVEQLTVVSGPSALRTSALEAVKQWRYKPYLLNGNPTTVETTITVTYSLTR